MNKGYQWIKENSALLLILLTAVVLRFWNFSAVPFTHDEFSALFRTRFDNFGDLIYYGVRVDGHPAAIQVLMYYWIQWFGESTVAVKLPFTLMGVLSVYLVYAIGKKVVNKSVGLISAATITALQFTVMYSQIARPYISGFFFSLLLVLALAKMVKEDKCYFWRNSVFFVLSMSLCTYNHYFSFLFALIVGITAFFLFPKKVYWKLLLMAVAVFVLYIPFLPTFFYQLNVGGIGGSDGWLGAPEPDFIVRFIAYIFNFSWELVVLLVGVIGWTLVTKNYEKPSWKWYLLLFSWFFLPFLIGYIYSVKVNPVIQYSTLIFSFVYLVYFLFIHMKELSAKANLIIVAAILIVGSYSLVVKRQYYHYFYQSPYYSLIEDMYAFKKQHKDAFTLSQSHIPITNYYCKQANLDSNFVWVDSFENLVKLQDYVKQAALLQDEFFLGSLHNLHPVIVPIIQVYFPTIQHQKDYWGATSFAFRKGKDTRQEISTLNLAQPTKNSNWQLDASKVKLVDKNPVYQLEEGEEWGLSYSQNLAKMKHLKNDFLDVKIVLDTLNVTENLSLVVSLSSGDSTFFWREEVLSSFVDVNSLISQDPFILASVKLSDMSSNKRDVQFKTYLWNKDKKAVRIKQFEIKLRSGNPVIYGIVEPF
jgi:hypothetical protein